MSKEEYKRPELAGRLRSAKIELSETDVDNLNRIRKAAAIDSNERGKSIALSLTRFLIDQACNSGKETMLYMPDGSLVRILMSELDVNKK